MRFRIGVSMDLATAGAGCDEYDEPVTLRVNKVSDHARHVNLTASSRLRTRIRLTANSRIIGSYVEFTASRNDKHHCSDKTLSVNLAGQCFDYDLRHPTSQLSSHKLK